MAGLGGLKPIPAAQVADMVADAAATAYASGFGKGKQKGRREVLEEIFAMLGPASKVVEKLKRVYARDL